MDSGQWTLVKDCLMVSVSIDLSGHDDGDGWVNVWETETLSTPTATCRNAKLQNRNKKATNLTRNQAAAQWCNNKKK